MTRFAKVEPVVGFECEDCGFLNFQLLSSKEASCKGCHAYYTLFQDQCPACDGDSHFGGCEHSECACSFPQCVAERTATPKVL